MTTLDHATERRLIPTMAEIKGAVENLRTDARTLWLPVTSFGALLVLVSGALLGAGMWIERTNDRTASTGPLSAEVKQISNQLATMQGSINALMAMQSTVADTKAQVGSLSSRLDSMDIAIQTQNVWISTTRERLKEQGFETQPFNPPPTGGRRSQGDSE